MANSQFPFLYGKNTFAKVYLGNPPKPFRIVVKKIHIQEKATVSWDGVCGEQRSRPIKNTDGFIATFDTYDDGSYGYFQNFIASQANDDALQAPFGLAAGIVFRGAGGVVVVTFGGMSVLDPLDYTIDARNAANMGVVRVNCQTCKIGAAAVQL